jgi:hypothetical protein
MPMLIKFESHEKRRRFQIERRGAKIARADAKTRSTAAMRNRRRLPPATAPPLTMAARSDIVAERVDCRSPHRRLQAANGRQSLSGRLVCAIRRPSPPSPHCPTAIRHHRSSPTLSNSPVATNQLPPAPCLASLTPARLLFIYPSHLTNSLYYFPIVQETRRSALNTCEHLTERRAVARQWEREGAIEENMPWNRMSLNSIETTEAIPSAINTYRVLYFAQHHRSHMPSPTQA